MAGAADWPLQQFVLLPWSWHHLVYRRRRARRTGSRLWALVCRALLFLCVDVGLHAILKVNLRVLSDAGIRWFYRRVLPLAPLQLHRIDDSVPVHVASRPLPPCRWSCSRSAARGARHGARDAGSRRERSGRRRGPRDPGRRGDAAAPGRTTIRCFVAASTDNTLVSMARPAAGAGVVSISFFTFLPFDERHARRKAVARCPSSCMARSTGKVLSAAFAVAAASTRASGLPRGLLPVRPAVLDRHL
jgi:hypothetical protein